MVISLRFTFGGSTATLYCFCSISRNAGCCLIVVFEAQAIKVVVIRMTMIFFIFSPGV